MFSGVIGTEYEMLRLICPSAAEMSRLVGEIVSLFPSGADKLNIVELGGGTGITTLAILTARDNVSVTSVDNEPAMQNQAKQYLEPWREQGKLGFSALDALSALNAMDSNSVDIVASAYTLHNFLDDYRNEVIREIYRVLKSGGEFINGDRFALDDVSHHTRMIQEEVAGYFKVFTGINRLDLLEHWIIHLFSDESQNHVMRESKYLDQLREIGFTSISLAHRKEVNALVTARK
jgi:ubiquinone/menaquinone biosynthesis C-methylase UbiE